MSLRKQVRSKKYMDEIFDALELGKKPRYGRQEFAELGEVIGKKYVGGVSTQTAIDNALAGETPEPEPEFWTLTLQLNGGTCLGCGNAEGGEGFVVTTGTTEDTIYNVIDLNMANLDREGFMPVGISYDEAGEQSVGEEVTISGTDDITVWVQWVVDEF